MVAISNGDFSITGDLQAEIQWSSVTGAKLDPE